MIPGLTCLVLASVVPNRTDSASDRRRKAPDKDYDWRQ